MQMFHRSIMLKSVPKYKDNTKHHDVLWCHSLWIALIQLLDWNPGSFGRNFSVQFNNTQCGKWRGKVPVLKRNKSTTWSFIFLPLNCITAIKDSNEYICVLFHCAYLPFSGNKWWPLGEHIQQKGNPVCFYLFSFMHTNGYAYKWVTSMNYRNNSNIIIVSKKKILILTSTGKPTSGCCLHHLSSVIPIFWEAINCHLVCFFLSLFSKNKK